MRIIMLGTGHAVVTECYNTCWLLADDDGRCLLVDGGGGSGIVTQMAHAGVAWQDVREVFVTHRHIDHLLGIVWVLRMVAMEMRRGAYVGDLRVVADAEVMDVLLPMVRDLLWGADNELVGERIRFETVAAQERSTLLGRPVTFFDMHAHDVSQLGFRMGLEGGRTLVCCGDVHLQERDFAWAEGADWLLHEAFCLSDHPAAGFIHRAGHSTVAEAAKIAARVGAANLLLYHTEDGDLAHRRERYVAEAAEHYAGRVHVPDDLEVIEL